MDTPPPHLQPHHEPTIDDSPWGAIVRALALKPDAIVNSSICLMENLATVLVEIVGEQGFETLLSRSSHVVTQHFRWFECDRHSRSSDPEFESLRHCFANQDPEQARLASHLLFETFINYLVLLIGEHLTMTLLRVALERAGGEKDNKAQNE